MAIRLNHTIVWCRDKKVSAGFLADTLGLPAPQPFGPFLTVETSNGVSLDYHEVDGEIASQHYAFLIDEPDFDPIFGRIQSAGSTTGPIPVRADPVRSTTTTAAGASTSPTPTATSSRSSPGRTGAAGSTCGSHRAPLRPDQDEPAARTATSPEPPTPAQAAWVGAPGRATCGRWYRSRPRSRQAPLFRARCSTPTRSRIPSLSTSLPG